MVCHDDGRFCTVQGHCGARPRLRLARPDPVSERHQGGLGPGRGGQRNRHGHRHDVPRVDAAGRGGPHERRAAVRRQRHGRHRPVLFAVVLLRRAAVLDGGRAEPVWHVCGAGPAQLLRRRTHCGHGTADLVDRRAGAAAAHHGQQPQQLVVQRARADPAVPVRRAQWLRAAGCAPGCCKGAQCRGHSAVCRRHPGRAAHCVPGRDANGLRRRRGNAAVWGGVRRRGGAEWAARRAVLGDVPVRLWARQLPREVCRTASGKLVVHVVQFLDLSSAQFSRR